MKPSKKTKLSKHLEKWIKKYTKQTNHEIPFVLAITFNKTYTERAYLLNRTLLTKPFTTTEGNIQPEQILKMIKNQLKDTIKDLDEYELTKEK